MKKRSLAFLLVWLLCLCMVLPVSADASAVRLVDDADYLTTGQEQDLLNKLDEISARHGMDIVVVTVAYLNGRDISSYADDFYDYNGYRDDGILLLIADYERQWAISTTGYGMTVFNDAAQDYLADAFVSELSAGRSSQAFHAFADLCDEIITQTHSGQRFEPVREPFDVGLNLLISLGIGFLVALIATGVMKSKLKTIRAQNEASQYVKAGSLNITDRREIFLYNQVQRTRRQTENTGSRTGSSGRSHGGSRGSF